ncbi:uncharacterized protein Z518_02188 [Rhinocladiella mackenziei CBS 650.93]|uniref:Uncharacterized protein n=1 Tax=Rhinocladiella mackenziei CBS 650.93 TaxID=1442369 RepID=A0A0D2JEF5_9EURO|nr:uncharacterized protein Z518_02188 [Rhinocladiella mackenziei CBS 650.93]KIX07535.1 hypothetical protein Z518_02188 [Rhinocladiella mackenziei CBS 650.93]
MTTPETGWPTSTSVPETIKPLLNRFYELGDSKSAEAARRRGSKVFYPDGYIVMNKRSIRENGWWL